MKVFQSPFTSMQLKCLTQGLSLIQGSKSITIELLKRPLERKRRERKILGKSPKRRNKAQTKIDYTKLLLETITQNYLAVYYVAKLSNI